MADPITEPRESLTLIQYGVDDDELDTIIELMSPHNTGLPTVAAVLDLALAKLALWYDVRTKPQEFDLGRRAIRHRQRVRGQEIG